MADAFNKNLTGIDKDAAVGTSILQGAKTKAPLAPLGGSLVASYISVSSIYDGKQAMDKQVLGRVTSMLGKTGALGK